MKMGIGDRIKIIRKELTQEEFAEKIEVHLSSVQKWERTSALPKGDILERIHKFFKVNINWLLTGQGDHYIKDTVPAFDPNASAYEPAVEERLGLYGRTRQLEVEGKKHSVTLFEPKAARDPFAEAVSGLREIFNSRNQVLIPAIQANIRAFQISARRERQIDEQKKEIQQLREECEDLKQRIKTLEERLPSLTKAGASKAASET